MKREQIVIEKLRMDLSDLQKVYLDLSKKFTQLHAIQKQTIEISTLRMTQAADQIDKLCVMLENAIKSAHGVVDLKFKDHPNQKEALIAIESLMPPKIGGK